MEQVGEVAQVNSVDTQTEHADADVIFLSNTMVLLTKHFKNEEECCFVTQIAIWWVVRARIRRGAVASSGRNRTGHTAPTAYVPRCTFCRTFSFHFLTKPFKNKQKVKQFVLQTNVDRPESGVRRAAICAQRYAHDDTRR